MKKRRRWIPKVAVKLVWPAALFAVFFAGWYFGMPPGEKEAEAAGGAEVWTCSMHPQIRQPNPGDCPICAMDLIPLQPGGEGGLREVEVTPEAAALMDLRVSPVVRQPAVAEVRLFGKIAYDERNVTTTTARIGGRLDRFYVDYTGTAVSEGDHIAEIYSPELFGVQQDLIKASKGLAAARRGGTAAAVETQERLLGSARERLRLLQISESQIDAIAKQSEPADHITLFAPRDGVVTERHVVEGSYVKTGDPLFSVAGLQSVWLNLEAYESDLAWLHYAQDVAFSVEALPGREFHGRIAYLDPELDPTRRVVRVRVNVDNAARLLKPGMFARAEVTAKVTGDGRVIDPGLAGKWISPMHPEVVRDEAGQCPICGMDLVPAEELGFIAEDGEERGDALLVPVSAVLRTGLRAVVYVRIRTSPAPVFEGREIVLGARVGEHFIVDSGLESGEKVVTRGAFKLDSELQLKARPSMMNRDAGLVEVPAAEAEAALLGQWGAVPRALGRLREAAKDGDEEAAAREIATIGAAVERVDTGQFHAKTLAMWNEFSGRLRGEVALARRKVGDPATAYRDLSHAVEEAGRYLGLPYQTEGPIPAGDPGKVEELRELLAAYFALSEALAADDEAGALAAAVPFASKLGEGGEAIAGKKDIASLREAFREASEDVIGRVRDYGVDRVGNAYVVHCPMVSDNEGGDWLSAAPQVVNPYFGAEMLDCGVVRESLSFEPENPHKARAGSPEHRH